MKKSVEQKVKEELPEFAQEVETLSTAQINTRLSTLAKDAEAVQDAKEEDEELDDAKATARGLAAPYNDAKKVLRLKTRYLIKTLKDRGVA